MDLDPAIIEVAKQWFGFEDGERMSVHVADGVQFMKNLPAKGSLACLFYLLYRSVHANMAYFSEACPFPNIAISYFCISQIHWFTVQYEMVHFQRKDP